MKEGRRVIVPTQRQMEQMARKQAEGVEFKNKDGLTGMELQVSDIEGLKLWLAQNIELTEKEKREILEYGVVDKNDKFLTLNVIRILEAIRDGKTKNERDDKNFKYSMDKLIKKWANSEVEVLGMGISSKCWVSIPHHSKWSNSWWNYTTFTPFKSDKVFWRHFFRWRLEGFLKFWRKIDGCYLKRRDLYA